MIDGIVLNDVSQWMARAWIARNLIAYIQLWVDDSTETGKEVSELLLDRITDPSCARLDLSCATEDELAAFYRGVAMGHHMARSRGAASWHEPATFPEFMRRFDELLEAVGKDDRVRDVRVDFSWRRRFAGLQELLKRDREWWNEKWLPCTVQRRGHGQRWSPATSRASRHFFASGIEPQGDLADD